MIFQKFKKWKSSKSAIRSKTVGPMKKCTKRASTEKSRSAMSPYKTFVYGRPLIRYGENRAAEKAGRLQLGYLTIVPPTRRLDIFKNDIFRRKPRDWHDYIVVWNGRPSNKKKYLHPAEWEPTLVIDHVGRPTSSRVTHTAFVPEDESSQMTQRF